MSRYPADADADADPAEAEYDARSAALHAYLETACGPAVADRLAAGALAGLGPESRLPELTAAARSAAIDHLRATRRLHPRCRRAAGLLLMRRESVISSAALSGLYHHLDRCHACGGFAARLDAADWDLKTALGAPAPTAELGRSASPPAAPAELAGWPEEPEPPEGAPAPEPAAPEPATEPELAPAPEPVLDPPPPGAKAAHERVGPTLVGRRARGGRRRLVLVLLGLVMVGAAAVVAVIVLGGGLATRQTGRVTQPTPSGSTVAASGSEVRTLRVPFEVDGVRWTVFENPRQGWVSAGRRIVPAAGRVWVFAEVRVRNLGRRGFAPCALHYRVGDASGALSFPDARVGTGTPQAQPAAPLADGALTECHLGFQVPARAQGRRLLFDAQSTPARYEVPL